MTEATPSRLDRLEALAETIMLAIQQQQRQLDQNSQDIKQNSEVIRQNSQEIRQNSEVIRQNSQEIRRNSRDLRESMVEAVDMMATLAQQIEENSIYIRGLQAENRNILSVLMEQRGQGD